LANTIGWVAELGNDQPEKWKQPPCWANKIFIGVGLWRLHQLLLWDAIHQQ
jgi:hypothetical protein